FAIGARERLSCRPLEGAAGKRRCRPESVGVSPAVRDRITPITSLPPRLASCGRSLRSTTAQAASGPELRARLLLTGYCNGRRAAAAGRCRGGISAPGAAELGR
ncbi:MAG: hypothetical protein AB7V46_16515, partial [Thermomicrobiales bacterium]